MEAVIDAIESENLLERVRRVGNYIRQTCIVGPIVGHQGAGFLTGLRTTRPAKEIQAELLECGILAGTATDPNILRLLPAVTQVQLLPFHLLLRLSDVRLLVSVMQNLHP